jgi:GT2 family glycosyltransferase
MQKGDVALCPQRWQAQPAKSNVKLTQAMAMMIPVIGSPIKAYTEIIENGVNGYIANTKQEWYDALVKLKDERHRIEIASKAVQSIANYNIFAIVRDWTNAATKLLNSGATFESKPIEIYEAKSPIDIVIPCYNGVNYLKLCIDSIKLQTTYPFNLIISDAGSNEETWKYLRTLKGIDVLGSPDKRLTFSEACNAGIRKSSSGYVVILNSDTIVGPNWLEEMLACMQQNRVAACGVLSNCDRGWLHGAKDKPFYPMALSDGTELIPGMKYEQIAPKLDLLYAYMGAMNNKFSGQYVKQEWVAAYAVCYARSALNEVGLFDTQYHNGCEDLDLNYRLIKYGYKTVQALGAFVFHFGGVSRRCYQLEDRTSYDAEDKENHDKYDAKWSKPRIAIWTGPGWEKWDHIKVDEGMAGSETWACYLAREFHKAGYQVTIYGDPETEVSDDGVLYKSHEKFIPDSQYLVFDALISSRSAEPCKINVHALKKYIMTHDVFLASDRNYDTAWNRVHGIACLSEWHKNFLSDWHGIPKDRIFLTANGLSPEHAWSWIERVKKPGMVWSSSPDRGLLQLLYILPEIREIEPAFELVVCYGFHNWKTSAIARNDVKSLELIQKLQDMLEQPGVIYKGRVSKTELASLQGLYNCWLYPSWFTETFCVTAIENAAAVNTIVCSRLGGLTSTLTEDTALWIDGAETIQRDRDNPELPEPVKRQFLDHVRTVLTDSKKRIEVACAGHEHCKKYRWGLIAQEWINKIESH